MAVNEQGSTMDNIAATEAEPVNDHVEAATQSHRAADPLPRKNEKIDLTITDVTAEGFGVGRYKGFAVFVEGALPGERLRVRILKVKRHYGYGKIERILMASPHRQTETACPHAAHCGGCQWQHCAYPAQLLYKRKIVADALEKIGHVSPTRTPVPDVIGMAQPYHYRNKAQFPIGMVNGQLVAGPFASRSHRIIPVTHCNIQHPIHEAVLKAVLAYMMQYGITAYDEATHTGLVRHVVIRTGFATGETMVIVVINGQTLPPHSERLTQALSAIDGVATVLINRNTAQTNVILGAHYKILTGSGFIQERIGHRIYQISPSAFFQVNPVQTRTLYDTVLEVGAFSGTETVIDAHAGAGGIALYIAQAVKRVYGVEIVPEAVADAKINAEINGVINAEFICGAAETTVAELLREKTADVIILDPPRKGCSAALINTTAGSGVSKIIYVSCDPATLARDVKVLCEHGYAVTRIQPVDLFPMTAHVECVVLLSKVKAD